MFYPEIKAFSAKRRKHPSTSFKVDFTFRTSWVDYVNQLYNFK